MLDSLYTHVFLWCGPLQPYSPLLLVRVSYFGLMLTRTLEPLLVHLDSP
jgi:hypothetical protein